MLQRLFAAFAMLVLSACASAHGPELDLRSLDHLKRDATEKVDIELGPTQLAIAGWMLGRGQNDPDSAALRDTLKACKSVRIRSYEFGSDFDYPQADIEAVRSQLAGPGWSQLATVRDRSARENLDVYIALEQEKVTGFVLIVSGRSELTIVNIVGSLDVRQIERLRAQFGAPSRRSLMADDTSPDL